MITLHQSNHNTLIQTLVIATIMAAIALAILLALPDGIQYGLHAEKHSTAAAVRQMFSTGQCKNMQNTVELYSPSKDRWLFLCFADKKKIGVWFLFRATSGWREITAFIVSNPSYLANVLRRDGYKVFSGVLPDYLQSAIIQQVEH
ncbi:MAG: hypothetical protein GYA36_17425 [Veillonellaceae bacterium]|nr:hypothetical protein [Veillonellaceae bacterium]